MTRKRIPRPVSAPAMVMMAIFTESELAIRVAGRAFREGWAAADHFNILTDVAEMLLLSASSRKDATVEEVSHLAREALHGIAERWKVSKVVTATEQEAHTLECLAEVSADYWRRRTTADYRDAQRAVRVYRQHQIDTRGAA